MFETVDFREQICGFNHTSEFKLTGNIDEDLFKLYERYNENYPATANKIKEFIGVGEENPGMYIYTDVDRLVRPNFPLSISCKVFECYRLELHKTYTTVHLEYKDDKIVAVEDTDTYAKSYRLYNPKTGKALSNNIYFQTKYVHSDPTSALLDHTCTFNKYSLIHRNYPALPCGVVRDHYEFDIMRKLKGRMLEAIKDIVVYETELLETFFTGSFFADEMTPEVVDAINSNCEFRVCKDCKDLFIIDDSTHKWYESRGMNVPKRCPCCRDKRKNSK